MYENHEKSFIETTGGKTLIAAGIYAVLLLLGWAVLSAVSSGLLGALAPYFGGVIMPYLTFAVPTGLWLSVVIYGALFHFLAALCALPLVLADAISKAAALRK